MKLKISEDAYDDITSIFEYTIDTWGVSQATKYRRELLNKLKSLERNPYIGVKKAIGKESIYRLYIHKHTALYRIEDSLIFVIRIMHQSKDIEQVFGKSEPTSKT